MSISLQAQSATQRDLQTWLNLTATGFINKENQQFDHFKYWLEGQERIGDDISRSSQTLFRPGLGYALTQNTSLWVGYAWVQTSAPFTLRPFVENRIWEQLLWVKKSTHATFISRTRIEQRFLRNNPRTAYRARQLLKVSIPFKNQSKWSWVSSEEVFWHHNNYNAGRGKGFDQNRFFTGLGYQFNSQISTEMGYMNQYIHRFNVPHFLNNIISVNLLANF